MCSNKGKKYMLNFSNPIMGMNSMYNMNPNMNLGSNTTNINQYYQDKYGCADCFKTQPYLMECPKQITPIEPQFINQNFFQKLIRRIFG